MKKVLLFFALFMGLLGTSWAYDFYAVSPSGQTLFYNIINDGRVEVTWYQNVFQSGSLTIPGSVVHNGTTYSVTNIGIDAFSYCTGLTSVTIPNSVTYIGERAFMNCGLTSVTIPYSVTSIGDDAFSGCGGLTSVNYTGTIAQWCNIAFLVNSANPIAYSHSLNINGSPVTNLVIPDSVTSIGKYTFYGCSGLTSITIPDGVTSIGWSAFYGCSGLTSVTFNADSCTCLFFNYPFEGCSNITNFTFGNNVTIIPTGLCCGLTGLTSITIPNSVTSIDHYAFRGCSGLTSVTIPNSVTSIGIGAFNGCSGLTSVTIGSGVTDIGGGAFYNCTGLTEIHSLRPVAPQLGTYNGHGAFDGVPSSIPVHIPCGSSTSYYSRWSYFSNFVEEDGFTFTATSANEQQGTVQILTMPTCTSPQAVVYASANSGYHFDHWSDGSTSNPYSLTVTDDLDLIGYFVSDGGTEGIEEVGSQRSEGNVYAVEGKIVVDGDEGETVRVYDVTGRMVQAFTHSSHQALPAGVYMVKVGQHPARKVVIF